MDFCGSQSRFTDNKSIKTYTVPTRVYYSHAYFCKTCAFKRTDVVDIVSTPGRACYSCESTDTFEYVRAFSKLILIENGQAVDRVVCCEQCKDFVIAGRRVLDTHDLPVTTCPFCWYDNTRVFVCFIASSHGEITEGDDYEEIVVLFVMLCIFRVAPHIIGTDWFYTSMVIFYFSLLVFNTLFPLSCRTPTFYLLWVLYKNPVPAFFLAGPTYYIYLRLPRVYQQWLATLIYTPIINALFIYVFLKFLRIVLSVRRDFPEYTDLVTLATVIFIIIPLFVTQTFAYSFNSDVCWYIERSFKAFLNGAQGEYTGTDDLDRMLTDAEMMYLLRVDDIYAAVGAPRLAPFAVLRRHWRLTTMRCHPDRRAMFNMPPSPIAEEFTRYINLRIDELEDARAKVLYDIRVGGLPAHVPYDPNNPNHQIPRHEPPPRRPQNQQQPPRRQDPPPQNQAHDRRRAQPEAPPQQPPPPAPEQPPPPRQPDPNPLQRARIFIRLDNSPDVIFFILLLTLIKGFLYFMRMMNLHLGYNPNDQDVFFDALERGLRNGIQQADLHRTLSDPDSVFGPNRLRMPQITTTIFQLFDSPYRLSPFDPSLGYNAFYDTEISPDLVDHLRKELPALVSRVHTYGTIKRVATEAFYDTLGYDVLIDTCLYYEQECIRETKFKDRVNSGKGIPTY